MGKKFSIFMLAMIAILSCTMFIQSCEKEQDVVETIEEKPIMQVISLEDIKSAVYDVVPNYKSKTLDDMIVSTYERMQKSANDSFDIQINKQAVNTGNGFIYEAGEPIITLTIGFNSTNTPASEVTLDEKIFKAVWQQPLERELVGLPVVSHSVGYVENQRAWTGIELPAFGFFVKVIIYEAPAEMEATEVSARATFIESPTFERGRSDAAFCTNNTRRMTVAVRKI